jgi:hypothetical protein
MEGGSLSTHVGHGGPHALGRRVYLYRRPQLETGCGVEPALDSEPDGQHEQDRVKVRGRAPRVSATARPNTAPVQMTGTAIGAAMTMHMPPSRANPNKARALTTAAAIPTAPVAARIHAPGSLARTGDLPEPGGALTYRDARRYAIR